MASYTYDATGRLTAWVDELQNPDAPVMFLLTGIAWPLVARVVRNITSHPHNVITDGEKWCPLIKGNNNNFHSYPTGYTGMELTSGDKTIIITSIADYVDATFGDDNGVER